MPTLQPPTSILVKPKSGNPWVARVYSQGIDRGSATRPPQWFAWTQPHSQCHTKPAPAPRSAATTTRTAADLPRLWPQRIGFIKDWSRMWSASQLLEGRPLFATAAIDANFPAPEEEDVFATVAHLS